ncbi:MAG: Spore peptidoglycan hydrolase [Parcubacteria group bacterium GW2011_GWB1_53_43]|nr:MAG: Spore peptidoglycan hydrolase [Parcubacteria group bacterium GW2011_GWB1_53_43]
MRGHFKISSGGYRYVSNILASSSNPRGYDEKLGAQWVRYNTKRGDEHIVWYEDARSMGEKIKLAKDNNLAGFSLWVIGLEDPALWDTL